MDRGARDGLAAMQLKVLLRLPPIGIPSIDQMSREDLLKICIAAYCFEPLLSVSACLLCPVFPAISRVMSLVLLPGFKAVQTK